MRKLVFAALSFVIAAVSYGQNVPAGFDLTNYGVRIEPDKRVMVVLATIEAARTTDANGEQKQVIETDLSASGQRFREQLKSDLAMLNEDLRKRISTFLINHKKRYPDLSDAEIVAPFISMAYALSPVPDLADPVVTTDLPGNILDVLDFAPLVRDFYRRSSFAGNLNEYIKTYNAAADKQLRASTQEMVGDLLGYIHTRPQLAYTDTVKVETARTGSKSATLRQTETRERERRFFVVPELLAPTKYVHFLNVKDDYYVVLPPETDATFSEVRRGFLQFVIDPIVLNHSKDIAAIRDTMKKALDERRKTEPSTSPDVYLMIARSLVAAIDAKQVENTRVRIATAESRKKIAQMGGKDPTGNIAKELEKFKQQQADETALKLSEDYDKGALLVFYFADQIKGLEDSEFNLSASMREMILALDPAKEINRYAEFAQARERAKTAREERKRNPTAAIVVENPVVTSLLEVQKTIDAKNYVKASADLKGLSEKYPGEARIYYNIGRVASLSAEGVTDPAVQKARLLEAKSAYENVIKIAQTQRVDDALVSLSYVALAKIYEFYDEKAYAMQIYDAAIRIGPVAGGAHAEALAGKARLLKDQQ